MSDLKTQKTTDNLFDLSDKVALITGASGHLGLAMTKALANAGARLVVASRDTARAEATIKDLELSTAAFPVRLDYRDESSIKDALAAAIDEFGCVDILVNNGNEALDSNWRDVDKRTFDQTSELATGYFLAAREFRDRTVESERTGSIVMLGSMYGSVGSYPDVYEDLGPPNGAAYQFIKGGIIQLTRHLAVYWAKDGVRVNCLSPGPFPTEAVDTKLVDRIQEKCPMKRIGYPHELAGPLLLLASDAGSYMTGHNLVVDGGWTAW